MHPRIKRLLSLLLALTMMFSVITPVSASAASTAHVPSNTVEIEVGKTATLKVSGVYLKTTWTSSDNNVATVSSNGTVTGIAPGTATITATSKGFGFWGKASTTKFTVIVTQPEDLEKVTVKVGEIYQLSITSSGGIVTWKSSNKNIADVNGNGLVTGVSEGDAIITATEKKVTGNPFFWWGVGRKTVITTTEFEVSVLPGDEQPTESIETEPLVATYTVTFESNGGSDVEAQVVEEGLTAIEPEAPFKEGYTFGGWYSDVKLTTAYDFAAPVIADLTLYAAWEEVINYYTVTFESNGGTAVEAQVIVEGETATEPESPAMEGHTFAGWYTDAELTTAYDFATPVTSDITLYAAWAEVTNCYTVTFESNGGSEVEPILVEESATISAPDNPVREGYIFVGWYTSAELDEMFLFDDDVITEDITLYAAWIYDDEDAILVEYTARQINVGYQQGNNADHVTQNVTLPTAVEGVEDVTITWGSSSGTISPEGIVTRPQGADEKVTLTVTASKNEATYSVEFSLNVIRKNDRDSSDIPNSSVIDIENMNPDGDADISFNEDKSQVTSIEGQYSDIVVENADDALDVIQNVHTILGIDDPYEELNVLVINSDEYGAEYTFAQVYNGYQVYGRRITVSVDENGITDSLSSGVCASVKLSSVNSVPQITEEEAEAAALALYGGECAANSAETALVYYALDEYADTPAFVYLIHVTGTNADGDYVDETVFINTNDSTVVEVNTNIIDASSETGSGKNELGQKVSFPVAFTWTDWYFYYMQDLDRDIQMYDQKCFIDFRIGSELNWWTDKTAISAYTNMIKTYDWYKNKLNRDSVDGNGLNLKVVVHNDNMTDNAYWSGSDHTLNFCDNSSGNSATATTAAALDVIAHEYTHGVVQFVTGGLPYQNAPGAINEGYADIFGCLVDGDWQMGEDWILIRDASNPTAYGDPDKMSSSYYIDYTTDSTDHGGVHTNSSLVYHAAYLMTEYGMSKTTLAKLWYKSLSMGYDSTSTFQTVRRNVLKAAKKISLSDNEIAIIKKAFDAVEIFGAQGDLKVTVSDANGNPISGAEVSIVEKGICLNEVNSSYSFKLDEGTYSLKVSAEGYVEYNANFEIAEAETTTINVVLVHEGNGTVSGKVVSATSALTLEGVSMTARSGMNVQSGDAVATAQTDSNGQYSMELAGGYYTIEMSLDGYTTGYMNVQVDGGEAVRANASLSPVMSSNTYRVVLTWGETPPDLDSHLTGSAADETSFHIYFGNKVANKADGTEIGNLDVDDTTGYGPETTTFIAETEGSYYFYVYRYTSSGSLPASGATVEVYNGENLIAKYTIDPTASSDYRYWNVFKIENGIFKTVNTITSSADTGSAVGYTTQVSTPVLDSAPKPNAEEVDNTEIEHDKKPTNGAEVEPTKEESLQEEVIDSAMAEAEPPEEEKKYEDTGEEQSENVDETNNVTVNESSDVAGATPDDAPIEDSSETSDILPISDEEVLLPAA